MKFRLMLLIVLFAHNFALQSCKNKTQNIQKNEQQSDRAIDTITSVVNSKKPAIESNKSPVYLEPLNLDALNKIWITDDMQLHLTANMRMDHRIFGYADPDTLSEKLILISIFTNEVQNNPFKCKFGSYYNLNTSDQEFIIKYIDTIGDFVKTQMIDSLNNNEYIYFEKKWIELE